MRRKRIRRFFRGVRQLLALLVLALIALLSYLYFYGLPDSWKASVLQELAKRGVRLEIQALFWDPTRGVVARGVECKAGNHGGMARIGELALNVRLRDLMRRTFSLETLDVDGADIQILTVAKAKPIVIERAAGSFHFKDRGVIQLEGVTGDFHGLHLEVNGRLDLSRPTALQTAGATPAPDLSKLREIINHLSSVRVGQPVQIRVSVDGRAAEPRTIRARVEVDGQALVYNGWKLDGIHGSLECDNGVLTIPALTIQAGGGKVVVTGSYDVTKRLAHFEWYSNLNPSVLVAAMPAARRPDLFEKLECRAAPELWFKGTADLGAADFWKSVEADGSFLVRDTAWKGNLVRELKGYPRITGGRVEIPNLTLVQDSGRMDGKFSYDIAASAADFDFTSTLDVAVVMNLLYPTGKNWFRTVSYDTPPLMRLTGRWAHNDPNGLQAKGEMDWRDWSSNGVRVKRTRARLDISGRRFHFGGLRLEREEGAVIGDFTMDFSTSMAELNATSTVAFAPLTKFIGPKTEEIFAPYHFVTPPRIQFKGFVNFGDRPLNDLWAHVECGHFKIWKFTSRGVSADVRSFRRSFEISKFSGELYGGRLEGDAMFDFSTPDQDWGFHCNVKRVDFDRFTHELWDYDQVKGFMTGSAEMSGIMKNSVPLKGSGEVEIADGLLWKIPLFGELSKFIPILGVHKAKKARASFTVAGEKARTEDMDINAGIMSLTVKGDYHFDKSLDFNVQGHFLKEAIIPRVLDVFTKAFEYHLGGKLNERKWEPRYLPKELLPKFEADRGEKEKNP